MSLLFLESILCLYYVTNREFITKKTRIFSIFYFCFLFYFHPVILFLLHLLIFFPFIVFPFLFPGFQDILPSFFMSSLFLESTWCLYYVSLTANPLLKKNNNRNITGNLCIWCFFHVSYPIFCIFIVTRFFPLFSPCFVMQFLPFFLFILFVFHSFWF